MSQQRTGSKNQYANGQPFVIWQQKDNQQRIAGQQDETIVQLPYTYLVEIAFPYEMDATENQQKDGEEDKTHLDGGERVNTVGECKGFWYKVMDEVVNE